MNTKLRRRTLAAISCATALLCAGIANADPVPLVYSDVDPYDVGYVPVPPSPPIPVGADGLTAMSDGNTATGFQYTIHNGDFSSNPSSTVGFQQRFDFDVSAYAVIDQIDFTWTGRYELGSPIFDVVSQLWLSAGNGSQVHVFQNGNDLGTDNMHTYTASFMQLGPFFDDVDMLLHDGLASLYVQSEIGSTGGDPLLPFITLDTREVSINVTGTLKNQVPTPGPVPLAFSAFGMILLARRRWLLRA